jgi:MFS family permease
MYNDTLLNLLLHNITSGHTYTTNTSLNKDNCGDNSTGTTDDQVQGLASDWTWYMELVIYSLGLLVMSVLGPLSDQLGRKPIIIGSVTLFIITFMLRTYAVYAGLTLYWYLLFCFDSGNMAQYFLL